MHFDKCEYACLSTYCVVMATKKMTGHLHIFLHSSSDKRLKFCPHVISSLLNLQLELIIVPNVTLHLQSTFISSAPRLLFVYLVVFLYHSVQGKHLWTSVTVDLLMTSQFGCIRASGLYYFGGNPDTSPPSLARFHFLFSLRPDKTTVCDVTLSYTSCPGHPLSTHPHACTHAWVPCSCICYTTK